MGSEYSKIDKSQLYQIHILYLQHSCWTQNCFAEVWQSQKHTIWFDLCHDTWCNNPFSVLVITAWTRFIVLNDALLHSQDGDHVLVPGQGLQSVADLKVVDDGWNQTDGIRQMIVGNNSRNLFTLVSELQQ